MKKRRGAEQASQFLETWWTTKEPFPVQACADAEGFFLSYLYYLATHKGAEKAARVPQEVSIVSYDMQSMETGHAIQKQTIVEGGVFSRLAGTTKRFNFGEPTYLVTSGTLAGTIASEISYVNLGLIHNRNKIKKGTTPVAALRPFHQHQLIWDNLNWRADANRYFGKKAHELRHYRQVYQLFLKSNPMALLLQWLTVAEIPHDSDAMLKNAMLWEGRKTQ